MMFHYINDKLPMNLCNSICMFGVTRCCLWQFPAINMSDYFQGITTPVVTFYRLKYIIYQGLFSMVIHLHITL
ncbi:hypothetical protein GDO81_015928 [Engystomops pustulosus]|uniref:Uncharacterized protein n=1 Tax=Engystomops pustulosus TaxID=76066 RepID=A0AAV7ANI1_ENGPU|nr:hypothetical protein GDO81_015928 [Engystomops pustulosus]